MLLGSLAACSEKQSDGGSADTPSDPGSSQVNTAPEEAPETEEEKVTAESTLTV